MEEASRQQSRIPVPQKHEAKGTHPDKDEGVRVAHAVFPFRNLDHGELDRAGTAAHQVLHL